jgi:hypothetical protein
MKKKKSAKKTVAKKAKTKKPSAKKAPARAKAAKPAKAAGGGTYTPQPVTGIGWAPFRYPLS